MGVKRIFVEKKTGYNVEALSLLRDLKVNLGMDTLSDVRIINRYDVEGIDDTTYESAKYSVFAEPQVDVVYDETLSVSTFDQVFAVEYLPGQYDQRADSAAQCLQILTQGERPTVRNARVVVLSGRLDKEQVEKIKAYYINPVEAHEASMEKPNTLYAQMPVPPMVEKVNGFIGMNEDALSGLLSSMGFAMDLEDLKFCQEYFRDQEKRDPSVTEMRMIDTYWSDHCRHTTFMTEVTDVDYTQGTITQKILETYQDYLTKRKEVYGERKKPVCLMDIATIGGKYLKKIGLLPDIDESDEINACSIVVNVDVNGVDEEWLVMFKNETHNHPTEIEPFGGAATCLGGAIRDPLSGRTYVYQAMRVTGSGDPRTSVKDTLSGKLPQRKITTTAAAGYSSYGNQIGLATGQVTEVYHEGYVAKHLEIGAVVGAAPRKNVRRQKPMAGDLIVLLGGRTGRDGCGGATGSSKAHTEESLESCGAEVQKGNPPEERKLQRLFRNPEVTVMIKKCNDFGAGGVSVAIGELADGLIIDLDAVPKKYEGLDGTELAISESQERMAVVIEEKDLEAFIAKAAEENLEANKVAIVTEIERLKMLWRGETIVDISREFLNSNGASKKTSITIPSPMLGESFFRPVKTKGTVSEQWIATLQSLNVASQKGLVERFDSTIGAGTVTMPFGGKTQSTPMQSMVAKIPVLSGETKTGTVMSYGFNPDLSKWSPYHGAIYAIVEAVTKIAVAGGDTTKIRLTLQEYFERLGNDSEKWGLPFAALLGAYEAQVKLGLPAIGGKDSMSGTFKELTVPPTLVAFAIAAGDVSSVVTPEFKKSGSTVVYVPLKRDLNDLPDFTVMKENFGKIRKLKAQGKILSASAVTVGGLAEAVSKMCFGNCVGFVGSEKLSQGDWFFPDFGGMVFETDDANAFAGIEVQVIGQTIDKPEITVSGQTFTLETVQKVWEAPLEKTFPTKVEIEEVKVSVYAFEGSFATVAHEKFAKPRVFIPVFPGTNCEYDTAKAFEKAGATGDIFVVKNLTASAIEQSIHEMEKRIRQSQIVMLPGGFSGGDEPDGSGKFIATAFRNPLLKEAVMNLLKERDGLMLGICNGFQALIKLGLVPYGEIVDTDQDSPTLTFNTIGRHVSQLVHTRICTNLSPWLAGVKVGDTHTVAVSHGEGRFVANAAWVKQLAEKGQIATQYVDLNGNPTMDIRYNPNGSVHAIEGITSPDGRILGKMGHSERVGAHLYQNVEGEKDQKIFESGVKYFL